MRALRSNPRSGQAIIFLMVVMVIGLLAILWNFDLHNIISTKVRIGNAGDSAALAAARWQGITMNLVGELNLMQAAIILEDPANSIDVEAVSTLRDRLALNGPLMGYMAAQSAAFLNLSTKDEQRISESYSSTLKARAAEFQTCGKYYYGVVEEPYGGAWVDYGNLLYEIASADMVVECANPKWFLFYNGSHILLESAFYNAIASEYWCWFELNGKRDLLTGYDGYTYWSPLPLLDQRPSVNSEYFSTDLERLSSMLSGLPNLTNGFRDIILNDAALVKEIDSDSVDTNWQTLETSYYNWHFYSDSWTYSAAWPTYDDGFPFREGWKVKDEFDYRGGADSAVNIAIDTESFTPGIGMDADSITWKAAAKPFGYLITTNGSSGATSAETNKPHYFGLVLPAFHQARLIPNDISSRPKGISEPGWDAHIYEHLPAYITGGIEAIKDNNCWYCSQLTSWEDPDFRSRGVAWLESYSSQCTQPGGSGSSTGGASDRR